MAKSTGAAVGLFSSIRSTGSLCALFVLSLLIALPACDAMEDGPENTEYSYDFSTSDHGWEAFFTDYPVGEEDDMQLTSDHRPLPDSTGMSGQGLFMSGVNRSDDVKMLFRRQVEGLEPGATYDVRFQVEFVTSAPSECLGIGGPPGEAVKIIAAAHQIRPEPFVEEVSSRDWYRLNVQHRNDPQAWYDEAILGHIANSRSCDEPAAFEMKKLTGEKGHTTVTANEDGQAWLLFGTRSGFEGRTSLFYTRFQAEFFQ